MELTAAQRLVPLALLAGVLMALAGAIVYRMRMTPPERERRRRGRLNVLGRRGDALITDVQGDAIYYSYSVSGVSYHASQDVSTLRGSVPPEDSVLIGPAYIKYLPRNPANSIVICELWSGLRIRTDLQPAAALRAQSGEGAASAPVAGD